MAEGVLVLTLVLALQEEGSVLAVRWQAPGEAGVQRVQKSCCAPSGGDRRPPRRHGE